MKKSGSSSKFLGEERIRETSAIIKRVFETAKKPPIINTEAVNSAKDTLKNEAKADLGEFVSQIFGIELKADHEVRIHKKADGHAQDHDEKQEAPVTSEHLKYFSEFSRHAEGKNVDETNIVIRNQLDAILAELRNLKSSSDELENVFKDVVIDTPPEKPGIYHLTFFEGFLKLVMKMRDKVQDGVVYAKLFRSRKQEKSYHSMAKKGGTSFTMHHDRAVATQTG